MSRNIMVVGLGGLGFQILGILARTPGVKKIIAADVDEVKGRARTDIVLYGALMEGFYPELEFHKVDLFDIDATAELLEETQPAVICNAASLAAWWVPGTLSKDLESLIYQAGAPFDTACYVVLIYKLMQALKKSGVKSHVVNCAYPDVTNVMLGKVGLAPTIGGGNAQNRIPRLKRIVSEKLGVPMRNVEVYLVGHHAWTDRVTTAPVWIKILVEGEDVSNKIPKDELLIELERIDKQRYDPFKGIEVRYHQQDIASAFAFNVLSIYFNTGAVTSAPGPYPGLPGAYPVRLSEKGAEVVLPSEITLEEAIKINEEAAKLEGIEEIREDGTLVPTENAKKALRKLGMPWEEGYRVDECEEIAKKVLSFLKERGARWE